MRTRRSEAIWIDTRKRWQINVQREGQRKTFTDPTPGKQGKHAAEAKADHWLRKFSTEQKLGDAWTMYLEDKRAEVSSTTYQSYEPRYNHITAIIPETRRLSAITLYDWQKVLDNMAQNGMKEGTIKQTQAAIMNFNAYALRRRWECEEIRSGDLQLPKQSAIGRQRTALTGDALKALFALDDTDSQYIYLFQFLPLTGLRIGEARALRWTDIDTAKHVLHLTRAVSADGTINAGKTANAARNIPLIPQAESILDEQKALLSHWQHDTELIFPDIDTGKHLDRNKAAYHWRQIAKQIKTDCTIHELRHTFISISKSELPLALLKQVAGHSASMDTLGTYAHETEKDITTSRDLLKQAFETCT